MNAKTDVFDKNVRPNLRDQLLLANDFARSVSQSEQDVERAAADLDDLSVPHQQALRREELECSNVDNFGWWAIIPSTHVKATPAKSDPARL
jgi:hypothetical protein